MSIDERQQTNSSTGSRADTRRSFGRLAGFAGLATVVIGLSGIFLAGTIPSTADSISEIAAYYASNTGTHKAYVIVGMLLAVPIAIFFAGVHHSLSTDRGGRSPWQTVFLYGAVMGSATAGLSEALYATLVLRGGAGMEPGTLQAISDGHQITQATLGVWLALAIGACAVASVENGRRGGRYQLLCVVAAMLGVLGAVDAIALNTGGVLAQAGFAGFIVWMLTTSVIMVRENRSAGNAAT